MTRKGSETSPARHEVVDHTLLPGVVEVDRQLVAVDSGHGALAEFLVEDTRARLESSPARRRRGDELAFDGEGRSRGGTCGRIRSRAAVPSGILLCLLLGPLPAGRIIAGAIPGLFLVEAALAVKTSEVAIGAAEWTFALGDLDVGLGQLVDKT